VNIQSRARSCPFSRALLVQRVLLGMRVLEASMMAGFSERTGHKGLKRFRDEGSRQKESNKGCARSLSYKPVLASASLILTFCGLTHEY